MPVDGGPRAGGAGATGRFPVQSVQPVRGLPPPLSVVYMCPWATCADTCGRASSPHARPPVRPCMVAGRKHSTAGPRRRRCARRRRAARGGLAPEVALSRAALRVPGAEGFRGALCEARLVRPPPGTALAASLRGACGCAGVLAKGGSDSSALPARAAAMPCGRGAGAAPTPPLQEDPRQATSAQHEVALANAPKPACCGRRREGARQAA
eukprot:scaffold2002_cov328-Prasinococcus_capsulatus_cf.AAC.6